MVGGFVLLYKVKEAIKRDLNDVWVRFKPTPPTLELINKESKADFDFFSGATKTFIATAPFKRIDKDDKDTTELELADLVSVVQKFFLGWSSSRLASVTSALPPNFENYTNNSPQEQKILSSRFITMSSNTPGVNLNFGHNDTTDELFLTFFTNLPGTTNFTFSVDYSPEGYDGTSFGINYATIVSSPPVYGCFSIAGPQGVVGQIQQNGGGFVAQTAAVHSSVYIEAGSEVCEQVSIFTPDSSPIQITGNSLIRGMTNIFAQNGGNISINNAKYGLQSSDSPTSGVDGAINSTGIVIDGATIYENAAVGGNARVTGTDTKIFGHGHIDMNAVVSDGAKVRGSSLVFESATVRDFAEVNIEEPVAPAFPQISGTAEIANLDTFVEGTTTVAQGAKVLNGAKIHGTNSVRGTCIVDFGEWFGGINIPDQQTNSCAPFSQYKKSKSSKLDNSQEIAAVLQRKTFFIQMANDYRNMVHPGSKKKNKRQ